MEDLFEGLNLEAEKISALNEAFEKAVMAKSVELMESHVEEKVAEAEEALKEEYDEKIENLEDTLDGYLSSVVEEFVTENAPIYEAQIKDEKATALLEMFDKMCTVAGVDLMKIEEAKSIDDESGLEYQVNKLEEKVSELMDELIEAKSEANIFLKGGLINEMKADLTIVEAEKFEKLAEMVTFSRTPSYTAALETIKESIVEARDPSFNESTFKGAELPSDAFKGAELDVKAATSFEKYV